MRIILASASPRRRELLGQIGLDFEVLVSNVEEQMTASDPGSAVEELSRQKAEAALRIMEDTEEDVLVIGADTIVALDGKILGKPSDDRDAVGMLRGLSGRTHEVYTGVTLLYRPHGEGAVTGIAAGAVEKVLFERYRSAGWGPQEAAAGERGSGQESRQSILARAYGIEVRAQRKVFHERTKVTFYPMTEAEIEYYVSSGDCMDKAGAYGIQGLFARYVKGIEGDYNNVVGLPVGRLYQEVREWLEH